MTCWKSGRYAGRNADLFSWQTMPRSPRRLLGFFSGQFHFSEWCEWWAAFSRGCMRGKLLWLLTAEEPEKTEEGGLTLAGSYRVHEWLWPPGSLPTQSHVGGCYKVLVWEQGRGEKIVEIWKNLETHSFQGMYPKKTLLVATEHCNPEILVARVHVPRVQALHVPRVHVALVPGCCSKSALARI